MDNISIVGVYLDGKNLFAGKVTNGVIEKSINIKVDNNSSEETLINEVISSIAEVIDDKVSGIGVGAPSLVNVEKGIVYQVRQIPSWKEVHIKDILENRFKVQVYVNNDANCLAAGEKYFGVAKGYENIVGVILDIGVGTGIVFKNHLYSGTNCGAGEFGAIPYKDYDYEYYCGEKIFENKYGLSSDTLYSRAVKNDKIALALYEQYGHHLGNLIKTIMYAVDPEIVVLGGNIAKAFPYFEKEMHKSIATFSYKHSLKNFKVVASENKHIAILGAVALFYDAQNMRLIK